MAITLTRGGRLYGYNEVTLDGKKTGEDTVQCCHCNTTIFLDPKKPAWEWCSVCDQEHCLRPECFICVHFMRKIEAAEARERQKILLWRACDNV